jgi:hypothetical protein
VIEHFIGNVPEFKDVKGIGARRAIFDANRQGIFAFVPSMILGFAPVAKDQANRWFEELARV